MNNTMVEVFDTVVLMTVDIDPHVYPHGAPDDMLSVEPAFWITFFG